MDRPTQLYRGRTSEWERFAADDPEHYICTDLPKGDSTAFWRSGQQVVNDELLPLIEGYGICLGTAVEIGCGIGRLALELSGHFKKTIGFDISPIMVAKANENSVRRDIGNTTFLTVDDPGTLSEQVPELEKNVDFVYSYLVFQHIEEFQVIEAYIRSVGRLLSTSGLAYLQFDTRPTDPLYHARMRLPNVLLPQDWRRGIRRVRRRPSAIETCFGANSLVIVQSLAPLTAMHKYLIRRLER